MLSTSVARDASGTALMWSRRRMSFAELQRAVDGFAARLAEDGVAPGQTVVLLLPNSPEFVVGVLAVAQLGGIAVPLNPLFQDPELRYYFRDCEPRAVVTTAELAERCARISAELRLRCQIHTSIDGGAPRAYARRRGPLSGDVLYQYSSGSTGVPKRVIRTQANLVAEANQFVETVGLHRGDRILTVVPLFHAHGFGNCLLAAIRAGAAMVLLESFQRHRVMEALVQNEITVFPGVPFMFAILASSPSISGFRLPALRLAFSAGAPLPKEAFDGFSAKFGIDVRQLYGSTETGSVSINLGSCAGDRWASVGLPMNNVEVMVADANGQPAPDGERGEILVRSPAMTAGYAGPPEVNEQAFRNGYFWSGDVGRKDPEGNLFITGRTSLFIDTGGYKVDPVEVEALLNQHPKVVESVVVGLRGNFGREVIKAVIVARAPCTADEIILWCRGQIADFKLPRIVEFRREIPKSPLGKVLRKYLQDGFGA